MLVINCKNYMEVAGERIVEFVRAAEKVSKRYGVEIAVAPPQHLIGTVAGSSIPILAQHVDEAGVGSTTGFVVPEMLRESGVRGSLINHSEHRVSAAVVERLVHRMRELGMISIVCVRDEEEAGRYAGFNPDYIAIEPPELIGSGRAISKERPDLITGAGRAIGAGGQTGLLCGAGIISGADVAKAVELGARGVLVASGIVKATDWYGIISEFARSMR